MRVKAILLPLTIIFAIGAVSISAGEADGVKALFDEMERLAQTPDQKVDAAKAFVVKAEELPDSRRSLCDRAIRLALDARNEGAVAVVHQAYAMRRDSKLGDEEELLQNWIKDANGMVRWRIDDEVKTSVTHKVFDLYEALFDELIEQGRFRDAHEALNDQQAHTRRNLRRFTDGRAIVRVLVARERALRERVREQQKLEALLEDAAAGGKPATEAGIILFSQDRLAESLSLLERGDDDAKPYIEIAYKVLPFEMKITPDGLRQDMVDSFANAAKTGEHLGKVAADLARITALKDDATRIRYMAEQGQGLGDLSGDLLARARAHLEKGAIEPKPQHLLDAAKGYEDLAKKDPRYGTRGMDDVNRFYLWKAVQLHESYIGASMDSGSGDAVMAKVTMDLLAKTLDLAGGYKPDAALSDDQDIARKGRLATVVFTRPNTELRDGGKANTDYDHFFVDVPKRFAGMSIGTHGKWVGPTRFEVTRAGTVHCLYRKSPGDGWQELDSKIGIKEREIVTYSVYSKFLVKGTYSLPGGARLIYPKQ